MRQEQQRDSFMFPVYPGVAVIHSCCHQWSYDPWDLEPEDSAETLAQKPCPRCERKISEEAGSANQ